jgi:hypothetical protein
VTITHRENRTGPVNCWLLARQGDLRRSLAANAVSAKVVSRANKRPTRLVPGSISSRKLEHRCPGNKPPTIGPFTDRSPTDNQYPSDLLAEADGNRTRQAEMLGLVGVEDRDAHQDVNASIAVKPDVTCRAYYERLARRLLHLAKSDLLDWAQDFVCLVQVSAGQGQVLIAVIIVNGNESLHLPSTCTLRIRYADSTAPRVALMLERGEHR